MKSRSHNFVEILGRETVHPFPARMAASIALKAVSHARTPIRVLDPMMGSGTVLALAKAKGHIARGVDIDPLAVLIGRVWTTPINKTTTRKTASDVLARAVADFKNCTRDRSFPRHADEETRAFIRYWFDSISRRELTALAKQIRLVKNSAIRNVLWCAFSRLIISKQSGASLALDLSHSRPHRFFSKAPRKPFDYFANSVEAVLKNCLSKGAPVVGPAAKTQLGDARKLRVKSSTIDLVLTSPPYLNAIDYMRCSKFSLVWMGKTAADIRFVRSASIGAEAARDGAEQKTINILKTLRIYSKLSNRHRLILRRYIEDMADVLRETKRVLVPGGKAIFVVGENSIQGTYIRNSKILNLLALDLNLKLESKKTRTLPPNRRYLPPPSGDAGSMNSRMRKEVVLTFVKTS